LLTYLAGWHIFHGMSITHVVFSYRLGGFTIKGAQHGKAQGHDKRKPAKRKLGGLARQPGKAQSKPWFYRGRMGRLQPLAILSLSIQDAVIW